jgi:hypothetical protein
MNEILPPVALVKAWLNIIQNKDIEETIKFKRIKILEYYFGSIELAEMYVE